MDETQAGLRARERSAEIDQAYAAYDDTPLAADDEWGDLASFLEAAGSS